jgi:hypothetical protein
MRFGPVWSSVGAALRRDPNRFRGLKPLLQEEIMAGAWASFFADYSAQWPMQWK